MRSAQLLPRCDRLMAENVPNFSNTAIGSAVRLRWLLAMAADQRKKLVHFTAQVEASRLTRGLWRVKFNTMSEYVLLLSRVAAGRARPAFYHTGMN